MQRMPFSSLRPRNSEAQRCGHLWSMTPTRPELSRNAISFSPSSIEAHRVAVGLQLRRHRRRDPVLPHQFAHDRARPDPDEILAVLPVHRDPFPSRRSRVTTSDRERTAIASRRTAPSSLLPAGFAVAGTIGLRSPWHVCKSYTKTARGASEIVAPSGQAGVCGGLRTALRLGRSRRRRNPTQNPTRNPNDIRCDIEPVIAQRRDRRAGAGMVDKDAARPLPQMTIAVAIVDQGRRPDGSRSSFQRRRSW